MVIPRLTDGSTAFLAAVVLSCCWWAPPARGQVIEKANPPEPQVAGFERSDLERDLAVEVCRLSSEKVQPGEAVRLEVKLANRSKELIHHVVRPGDGSEVGWREPHIYYTGWIERGAGQWEKLPAARYERCKWFVIQWQDDIVVLPPGKSITLNEWRVSPDTMLELQQPGRVRIQVHYAYRGGIVGRTGHQSESTNKGKMLGVPAFEIVSAPVEFEVVRPLDVTLKVKTDLKVNKKTRLSEVIDVRLVNRSKESIKAQAPTLAGDARLSFEMEAPALPPPALDREDQPFGKAAVLNPGEEAGILGDVALANGIDGTWECGQAGTLRIRAVYHASTWKPGAVIKSEWVSLKVLP